MKAEQSKLAKSEPTELYIALRLVQTIGTERLAAAELTVKLQCSIATLKRRMADARYIGADIVCERQGEQWLYGCRNWNEIARRLEYWLAIEAQRGQKDMLIANLAIPEKSGGK